MMKLSILSAYFCLLASSVFSQIGFAPEVKRVAVFKNGYAFTYREGETPISGGWASATNAPTGVLGTIWGYSTSPNVRVSQLIASETERREAVRVANLTEILLANESARIRFIDSNNSNIVYEGTYQIIGRNRLNLIRTAEEDDAVQADSLIIALKTASGTMMFPVNSLRNIEIIGVPKLDKTRLVKENRLLMKVDGAKDDEPMNLGIAALERGIRWIPAYRVEVKGAPIKEVKLELEAMLINELTDLKNTEVNFVVGVPHFLFQEQISPLSLNTAFAGVSGYFQTGAGSSRRDAYSNAIMSQVASTADDSFVTDGAPTVTGEEQTDSFAAEQLYLYKTDGINLKKGERASLRLFSLTVPASEVFEWTLNDAPNAQTRYMNSGGDYSNQQTLVTDLSSKIWYGLRLKNQTGMPWTTAPALAFREWKPLGQDMLTFTPVGGENILRVTPATEIVGTHILEEKSRVKMPLKYGGSVLDFDLVTVEGSIKLRNIKKEAVELVLTRSVVGEVIEAGDGGKITKEGLNLQSFNPNSIVKWNLNLPSGAKEIRYSYKIYVRR
ncbi:MAG: hypothetical protein LH614_19705 [Pyrinomonadaceae bacterium]|nr:hypothetical protein [Pyrinomonadaceae bacterium]